MSHRDGFAKHKNVKPHITPSVKMLAGTTFSCLACLVLFNLAINIWIPEGLLSYRDAASASRHTKIPALIRARENNDILLLGASGIVVPSLRCDDAFHNRKTRYDEAFMKKDVWMHSKSDFFANLLSQRLDRQVTITNAGVGGCIMSDLYLILAKYLDSGQRPKMILLTTGPKDFFDTMRPNLEKTPIYTEMADFPIRLADVIQGNTKLETSVPEMTEALLRSVSTFYFFRNDYRAFLAQNTANLTHHPESLEKALKVMGTASDTTGGPKAAKAKADDAPYLPELNKDLGRFRHFYLPVNKVQFEKQSEYLRRTIALAKSHNIQIEIVFMPFREEHINILKPDAWNLYKNRVKEVGTDMHVPVWDPQQELKFEVSDFEDSAHLNASGGTKLFRYLTERVSSDPRICESLTGNKVLIGQH